MTGEYTVFCTLGGVPVHYARHSATPYGSRGRPHPFAGAAAFVAALDACFAELWMICGYGVGEVVISAGAYTPKPGRHGLGCAFDLDAIHWPARSFVTLWDGWRGDDRRFYFGVESVLRRHFGQVLNYQYDEAHADHFHIDDAQPVGFRPESRALMLFLQGALTYVHKETIPMDGVWDDRTAWAVSRVLASVDITGDLSAPEVWLSFLATTARIAIGGRE